MPQSRHNGVVFCRANTDPALSCMNLSPFRLNLIVILLSLGAIGLVVRAQMPMAENPGTAAPNSAPPGPGLRPLADRGSSGAKFIQAPGASN